MKLVTRLILVGTMALSIACGATPDPVTAAAQARASGLVVALHVDNDAKGVRESLAEALTSAGYTVVAPRTDNKDVDIVANPHMTTTSDTRKVGILTPKGVKDVHVRLVLEGLDGGHLGVLEDNLSGNLTEPDLAPMARELVESRATTRARAQHGERVAMQAAQQKREDDEEQRRIEPEPRDLRSSDWHVDHRRVGAAFGLVAPTAAAWVNGELVVWSGDYGGARPRTVPGNQPFSP